MQLNREQVLSCRKNCIATSAILSRVSQFLPLQPWLMPLQQWTIFRFSLNSRTTPQFLYLTHSGKKSISLRNEKKAHCLICIFAVLVHTQQLRFILEMACHQEQVLCFVHIDYNKATGQLSTAILKHSHFESSRDVFIVNVHSGTWQEFFRIGVC